MLENEVFIADRWNVFCQYANTGSDDDDPVVGINHGGKMWIHQPGSSSGDGAKSMLDSTQTNHLQPWSSFVLQQEELLQLCRKKTQWLFIMQSTWGISLVAFGRTQVGFLLYFFFATDPFTNSNTLSWRTYWYNAGYFHDGGVLSVYMEMLHGVSRMIWILTDELLRMHFVLQLGVLLACGFFVLPNVYHRFTNSLYTQTRKMSYPYITPNHYVTMQENKFKAGQITYPIDLFEWEEPGTEYRTCTNDL